MAAIAESCSVSRDDKVALSVLYLVVYIKLALTFQVLGKLNLKLRNNQDPK